MGDKSTIEWTDATWNPVTGCSKVSPGCAFCYAEKLALTRLAGKPGYPGLPWTPENAAINVVVHPERIDQPLRWTRPRRIFVNSMSDLFHERIDDHFLVGIFDVMRRCTWDGGANAGRIRDGQREGHIFQVLTKRPERMRSFVSRLTFEPDRVPPLSLDRGVPMLPNGGIWLGTSVENDRWTSRVDHLRDTPAAVRFISAEPLLGPLPSLDLTGIDWLIVGGESAGPESRALTRPAPSVIALGGQGRFTRQQRSEPKPEALAWVRDLRDRANAAGVAFLFKQWGGRTPKAGGRELDGRTWDEYPA